MRLGFLQIRYRNYKIPEPSRFLIGVSKTRSDLNLQICHYCLLLNDYINKYIQDCELQSKHIKIRKAQPKCYFFLFHVQSDL